MVVAVVALVLGGGGSVWSNMCPVIYCKMAKSEDKPFAVRKLGLLASSANKVIFFVL